MNDAQLLRIQEEIMSSVNREQDLEEMITHQAKETAALLLLKNNAKVEFNDTKYVFAYRQTATVKGPAIFMTVADYQKYTLLRELYKPYTVTAVIDNNLSQSENLASIVEAFFRHVTGLIKPDNVDD